MEWRAETWAVVVIFFLGAGRISAQQPSPPAQQSQPEKKNSAPAKKPKLGPLEISVNWRARVEGWDCFEGSGGNSNYALGRSLLRIAVGHTNDHFDWLLEATQATILGLPSNAVVPAPQGQLGLGGTYYAANGNDRKNSNGFVKQAFVQFEDQRHRNLKLGRFEFFDGTEVQPKDTTLQTLVQNRVSQRLIANFGFSAVRRTFDGAQFSWNVGKNNLTFFGARPTDGVFQVDGMGELDIDVYYGAFTSALAPISHSLAEVK